MYADCSKEDSIQSLVNEINFLRKDPQTYASKLRKYIRYFKKNILMLPGMPPILTMEGSKAFEEAADFLDKLDPVPVLKQISYLNDVSNDVLTDILSISNLEMLGNINVDNYIDNYGKVIGPFSQALDFGSCNSELVIMNLLIDDGDSNRTNRLTITSPNYKLIGVNTSTHSQFLFCTVITLARHFFELGKEVGELSDENYQETSEIPRSLDSRNDRVKEFENKVRNMCVDVEDQDYDEEIEIPPEVIKVEKNEKVIEENGVKKKIRKVKKFKEDGIIETEIFKEII